jgi:plastocyanin
MKVASVFLRSSLVIFGSQIFLNGCSSSSDENIISAEPIIEKHAEKPAPSLYIVQIEQMKFLPANISVNAGDTIMWMNNDLVAHDITEEKSRAWTSSLLQPGKSWKLVATTGADYYCSIHQVMKGSFKIR